LLAACGGSQPPIGAPGAVTRTLALATNAEHGKSWMLPEAKGQLARPSYKVTPPLLYATNYFNSTNWDGVTVYRAGAKNPAPLARISDGIELPVGACIDGQGTLYVISDTASRSWVSEYTLGKTTPSRIITDGMNEASYCAIDGKGNLWVTNFYGPNVTEYLTGSKKPHAVITKGLENPIGIAFDPSGNLYVANFSRFYPYGVENVVVYGPGSKSPSRTITDGITSPRGITVDSNGTLYVTNLYQNTVAEYRSGQDDPFQTITQAMDRPEDVTVDKKGTLYVSNIANSSIVEFAPRSLTPLNRQISKGLYEPSGIAYYPAVLP
jgi:serine/threonine-protein kinase